MALKLEAFEDRGKGDFLCSTDFEDIICLFNGRRTIVEEIKSEPIVREGIAERFKHYLANPDLEDAVEGFVQTETSPEVRKQAILQAFKEIAQLASSKPRKIEPIPLCADTPADWEVA